MTLIIGFLFHCLYLNTAANGLRFIQRMGYLHEIRATKRAFSKEFPPKTGNRIDSSRGVILGGGWRVHKSELSWERETCVVMMVRKRMLQADQTVSPGLPQGNMLNSASTA